MKIILGLVFLFLVGCAQPKYIDDNKNVQNNNSVYDAAVDCSTRFTQSQICLLWYWEQKPNSSEVGRLIFKTYRLNSFDKTAIEVNSVSIPQVQLWMPGMGHGSTPTQVVQLDTGTYRVQNVFFIMPGEWDIRFQIKDGDHINDEAVVHITF
jgi:hypothetical protein